MVDLPQVPKRFVTVDDIQNRVTPGAVAAPYNMFAQALDKAADLTDAIGAKVGEKQGSVDALTIGPDGKPSVQTAPDWPIGTYGAAYTKAFLAGRAAQHIDNYTTDIAQLRATAQGDPEKFKTTTGAYGDQALSTLPQGSAERRMAQQQLNHLIAGNTADMVGDRARLDISNNKDSIQALISRKSDDASQIARIKGVDSPEFHAAVADLQAGYGQLSGNPIFGEPKAKTDLAYARNVGKFQVDALLGQAERLMQAGNFQSIYKLADQIDAIPNLSDAERVTASTGIRRYARWQQSQVAAERTGIRQQADVLVKGIGVGEVSPDDLQVQDVIDRANTVGDFKTAHLLGAVQRSKPFVDSLSGMTPAQRGPAFEAWKAKTQAEIDGTAPPVPATPSGAQTYQPEGKMSGDQLQALEKNLEGVKPTADEKAQLDAWHDWQKQQGTPSGASPPAAPGTPSDANSMAAAIIRREEAGQGATVKPYWDTNHWRGGFGSDTFTNADGSFRPMTQGDRVTTADAERDLSRRLKDQETAYVHAVGMEKWTALPAGARAAAMSVMWNYGVAGSGTNAVASAISAGRGAEGVAQVIERLDTNVDRRHREAAIARGGAAPAFRLDQTSGGGSPPPSVEAQMAINMAAKGYQQVAKTGLDHDWPVAKKAWEQGVMPDLESLSALAQNIAITGDKAKAKEFSDWVQNVTASQRLDQMTASQLEPVIANMNEAARTGGVSEAGAFLMKRADEELKERNQLRDSDPIGLSEKNGIIKPVAPLDWSNQQGTLEGQLRARGLTASAAADFAEKPAVSIFKPAEKAAFSTFLQQAPADQVLGALGGMARTLPGQTLGATMRDVGGDANARPYVVAAAMIDAGQAGAAKAIIVGQRIIAEKPELVAEAFKTAAAPVTPLVLPVTLFSPALTSPANSTAADPYSDTIKAATAIYAAGKGPQGTKDFDETLWRQSVEKAVGGFVYKRGTSATQQRVSGRATIDISVAGDGQKIIAPIPGMTQQEFALRLNVARQSELRHMTTNLGAPVTDAQFMDQSRFEALGGGTYLLKLGKGYVNDTRNGRPYRLDFNPRPPMNVGTVYDYNPNDYTR